MVVAKLSSSSEMTRWEYEMEIFVVLLCRYRWKNCQRNADKTNNKWLLNLKDKLKVRGEISDFTSKKNVSMLTRSDLTSLCSLTWVGPQSMRWGKKALLHFKISSCAPPAAKFLGHKQHMARSVRITFSILCPGCGPEESVMGLLYCYFVCLHLFVCAHASVYVRACLCVRRAIHLGSRHIMRGGGARAWWSGEEDSTESETVQE